MAVPIDVTCEHCRRQMKVADKFAGKKVKCPGCQGVITIPGVAGAAPVGQAPAAPAPHPSAPAPAPRASSPGIAAPKHKDEWFLQTEDGEQYGPVTKSELDHWAEEGRVDARCQILCDGWDQWKWAEEVYPKLGSAGVTHGGPQPVVTPAAPTSSPFELNVDDRPPSSPASHASPSAPASINPYAAPTTSSDAHTGGGAGGALTPKALRTMGETRPWLIFMAIVMFVGVGFGAIGGLIWFVSGIGLLRGSATGGLIVILFSLVMLALCAAIGYAAYCLLGVASNYQLFLRGGQQPQHMEKSLVLQKLYWIIIGIVTAIFLVLSLLMMLYTAYMAASVAGRMAGRPPF